MSAPLRHLGDGILLLVLLLVRGHSLGVICRDLMLPSVRAARQVLFSAASAPGEELVEAPPPSIEGDGAPARVSGASGPSGVVRQGRHASRGRGGHASEPSRPSGELPLWSA